ncbi:MULTISPECIES: hypothetical protein [Modicisalibacter]|uniref:Uncharacterized protein n=1 Tax=Modicisalibacter tunisiensis TaxID=390637 RepID=A0ABS7WXE9_9GAMM|nr:MULTISPECIES: hypothetical protein [Modicisalibacter]MBZ9567301.1 hypothetical protein [Modicisalibacter tunisiensis]
MHNLIVPSLVLLLTAAVIFGGQAFNESRLDDHIAESIATALDTRDAVEVTAMHEVNKGYGICGTYRLAGGESAAFFYNKANEHLALGSDSRRYRNNCRTP